MAGVWRSHLLKHGSAVQNTVALSSGESENYALLRSSAHALGIKAMLNDSHYGVKCEFHMRYDSSAARGTSARQGSGKTRHVDVRTLVAASGTGRTIESAQCPDARKLVGHMHEANVPSMT